MRRCRKRLQRQRRKPRHRELPVLPLRLGPVLPARIGRRDAPQFERRRPQAIPEDHARRFGRCMRPDMRTDRRRGRRTDRRHPARIFLGGVLGLLVHRGGIAGRDQPEHVVAVDARHRDFVRDRAQMRCDTVGERGTDAVAHLDMVAIDRDPAVAVDFHASQRAVRAGAVILGDAGHAGADENAAPRHGIFPARAAARSDAPRACRAPPACGPRRCTGFPSWCGHLARARCAAGTRSGRAAALPRLRRSAPPAPSSSAACHSRASSRR